MRTGHRAGNLAFGEEGSGARLVYLEVVGIQIGRRGFLDSTHTILWSSTSRAVMRVSPDEVRWLAGQRAKVLVAL